jgi:hypothetical protein
VIPFRHITSIDFEYRADDGELPHVWCLAARDLRTGTVRSWWRDDLVQMKSAPFPVGRDAVVCSYAISAEISCFLQLDWQPPEYLLDLYAEARCLLNGYHLSFEGSSGAKELSSHKYSMLATAFQLGVPTMPDARKEAMRILAMTRWEFRDAEMAEMLRYNEDDTGIAADIFHKLELGIDWPRALLRARYGYAVARMERTGVPIDTGRWSRLVQHWPRIRDDLIAETDKRFGVFADGHRSDKRILEMAAREGIDWPLTPAGHPTLDTDVLRDLAQIYPVLNELCELFVTLDQGKLLGLAIGKDGRNRTGLIPFRAVTGRNQPSSKKFVFGPACWLRSFIRADEGYAIAYLDWSSQEILLVAVKSGCQALINDCLMGDPYLGFAVRAGLVPPEALALKPKERKQIYGAIRERCKMLFLSLNYGRTAQGLASALKCSLQEAESLMRRHMAAYPEVYAYLQGVIDTASITRHMRAPFGWQRFVPSPFNARSIRNWPMQAAGAEMMRIAAMSLVDAGIEVCCPVHDAFLVSARLGEIEVRMEQARQIMEDAAEVVTGGYPIRVGCDPYPFPKRYSDGRGAAMWDRVMGLLERAESAPKCPTSEQVSVP